MALLTERELRQLSIELPSIFSRFDEILAEDASPLLERVLSTAEQPTLSAAHRAAACNALCGLVGRGAVSVAEEQRHLYLNATVWSRIITMYLERSGVAQAKPMRQVLTMLIKLLSLMADVELAISLANDAALKCVSFICTRDDVSCIRAAMNVLEAFLNNGIVDSSSLVTMSSISCAEKCVGHALEFHDLQPDSHPREPEHSKVSSVSHFGKVVIGWLSEVDVAPAAGRLLVSFFKHIKEDKSTDSLSAVSSSPNPPWFLLIREVIHDQAYLLEEIEHYVLPGLLRIDPSSTVNILRTLPLEKLMQDDMGSVPEDEIRLSLVVIVVIKDLGLYASIEGALPDSLDSTGLPIFEQMYSRLLVHASSSVRIAALRALIHTASSTESFSRHVLLVLKQTLPLFYGETDSRMRNEFISWTKKLFLRLQGAIRRLLRDEAKHDGETGRPDDSSTSLTISHLSQLQDHLEFVIWYTGFLIGELQPTASYQRHISALRVLQLFYSANLDELVQTGLVRLPQLLNSRVSQSELFSFLLLRLLLDLIIDPFDDVRSAAASLLEEFPVAILGYQTQVALNRAENLMRRTGRADYADGFGRLYNILYSCSTLSAERDIGYNSRSSTLEGLVTSLQLDVKIAQKDLQQAITSAPLHGHLIALRYVISRSDINKLFDHLVDDGPRQWRELHARIFQSCSDVWEVVKEVLCFDSPEGHVVLDPEEDEPDIGVKDTLSFCWRALKETSSLMYAITSNPGYWPLCSDESESQYQYFNAIGDLAFTQLAELRHRGAFSTVSQTFAACCIRCASSEFPRVAGLPSVWYQKTLSCIQEKAAALTRRSAGLPAMITGILVAYPHGHFFDEVIRALQTTAKTKVEVTQDRTHIRLPQVHALNCLKDVFTNTRLGPATEIHVAETLVIAVKCLEEDVWAIRNCGLMLLKSLLTRLTGGTSSNPQNRSRGYRRASKLTYEKYPVLTDLVVHLLQQDLQSTVAEAHLDIQSKFVQVIFPAVEIIERVGVPDTHYNVIKQLLLQQLDSPVWNLREKAAKTLIAMTDEQEILSGIANTLAMGHFSQNGLHGRLLCLKYLICEPYATRKSANSPLLPMVELFDQLATLNPCPVTAATYLETLACVVDTLYMSSNPKFGSFAKLSAHTTNGPILSKETLKMISTKTQLMWNLTICGGSSLGLRSGNRSTDCLLAALARLLVLFEHLENEKSSEAWPQGFLLEAGIGGGVALKFALKQVYRMLDTTKSKKLYSLDTYVRLLERMPGSDGKSIAIEYLTKSLVRKSVSLKCMSTNLESEEQSFLNHLHNKLDMNISDPLVLDSSLKLRGALLAHQHMLIGNLDTLLTGRLEVWIRLLKLAGHERSDLSTRLAAVSSIECFQTVLHPQGSGASTHASLLNVYFALYDTLIDDDEDVRGKGTAVASWVLSTHTQMSGSTVIANLSLSAPAAVSRLLEFFTEAYTDSRQLFVECIQRVSGITLTGHSDTASVLGMMVTGNDLPPVKDLLRAARKEDTSLFIEEKQNLYIDQVQEAKKWAKVIDCISQSAIDHEVLAKIERWALAGLEYLVDIAEHEMDGPLGWTSKPEVFILGKRVLIMVRLILQWGKSGLTQESSEHFSWLVERWKRMDGHPLWIRQLLEE